MNSKRAAPLLTPLFLVAIALGVTAQELSLPSTPSSVKFAAIGDTGSGDREQFEVANQMAAFRAKFPFDFVIMLGDNIYGEQGATDLARKFSQPYKALLDAGVRFYATLGNHDDPVNRQYPLWNMGGQLYYTYATKNVRFFALDSNKVDQKELAWLENALKSAQEDWKICYFHHPLYSDGATHGSAVDIRVVLEPLFVTYGVNVVFAGHDHIYERITPQKGIYHFVEGASGQLRKGDARRSAMNAKSFDQDMSFMVVEIAADQMSFQVVSRIGTTVDSGVIQRQSRPAR
ncbi:MAG: phoA 5 [Acidobacteria bacterium]|nr:phoA 5 [Acidobacteriota bacterium]